tara:strand:- start:1394 stop:1999 length:606 start_codon:yes stop_codon:yes gene_type:complete
MKKSTKPEQTRREVHNLGQHVLLFEGFFNSDFCEDCINMFEECERVGLTVKRPNHGLNMADKAIPQTNIPSSSLPLVTPLYDIITNEIIPEFLEKYPIAEQYHGMGLGGAKMQKTEPCEGYHVWHMEHSAAMDSYRSICAWGLFLNDVEEGGELEFLYQSLRIKPKQGDFVLWPAGYTHQHRGNPPISGVKYIYTGWIDTI